MARTYADTKLINMTTVPASLLFLRGRAAAMRGRGFAVETLTSPGSGIAEFEAGERSRVHTVDMPRRIAPVADLRAVAGLVRVFRRERPAIAHAATPKAGLLGMIAAVIARVPVRIYDIYGLPYMTATGSRRSLMMWTERIACRLAGQVLCVSHSLHDVVIADGICPPEKVKVLLGGSSNGVDAAGRFDPERVDHATRIAIRERLGLAADERAVVFAGRFTRDKGIVELLEAWAAVGPRHRAALLLVGEEDEREPLPLDGLMRDGEARMLVVGHTDAIEEIYAIADLVVLPTYREGFPNVPLEAAAMGIPVVATNVPGCTDAVAAGETGLLVPPRDAVALAAAIDRYLGDPALRRRHGAAGRTRVLREFGQQAIWDAICDEYDRLLTRSHVPQPAVRKVTT